MEALHIYTRYVNDVFAYLKTHSLTKIPMEALHIYTKYVDVFAYPESQALTDIYGSLTYLHKICR